MISKLKDIYIDIFNEYPQLLPVILVALFAELGYGIILPTLPLYLAEDLSCPVKLIGIIITTYALTETILKAPSGYLADIAGRKPLLLIGIISPTIAFLLMIFVRSPYYFIPIWALAGIGAASLWPTIITNISDIVKEERRATAMSVFNTTYVIGLGLGPSIPVVLNKYLQLNIKSFHHFTFFLAVVAMLFAFVICIAKVKNIKPENIPEDKYFSFEVFYSNIKNIFLHTKLKYIFIIAFFIMLSSTILFPVILIYLKQKYFLSEETIRILFFPVAVLLAVIAVPIGKLVDKIGKKKALTLGLVLIILSILFFTNLNNILVGIFIGCASLVGYVMVFNSLLALFSIVSSDENRALSIGIISTGQSLGFVFGPTIGGLLWDLYGKNIPFYVSCVFLSISCFIINYFFKEVKS